MAVKGRHVPVMVMGALSLAGTAAFGQDGPVPVETLSREDLMNKVESLEARLAKLEAAPAAESATVNSVMTQAAAQSAPPSLSGYKGGKFMLSSDDGNFTLQPYAQFQLRWVGNLADQGDYSFDSGFEIRRMKFGLQGNAFTKNLTYKFQWATSRSNGQLLLEDAQVAYKLNERWTVFGGQFKGPLAHEELVSSSRQLTVDRSIVNEILSGGLSDYVQGVGGNWKPSEKLEAWITAHDGQNSDNTNFQNGATDWGFGGRVEYLLRGDKKDYADFTARGTKSDLLVVGAGADISGRANDNRLLYVVDAQWENTSGLGIFGSFNGASTQGHGDNDDDTDYGFLAQAGQILDTAGNWEVFGRYGFVHFETADENISEITGGVNRYFRGHNLKATGDVVYLPNGAPAESGIGYVNSLGEDQFVFRLQLQLLL